MASDSETRVGRAMMRLLQERESCGRTGVPCMRPPAQCRCALEVVELIETERLEELAETSRMAIAEAGRRRERLFARVYMGPPDAGHLIDLIEDPLDGPLLRGMDSLTARRLGARLILAANEADEIDTLAAEEDDHGE